MAAGETIRILKQKLERQPKAPPLEAMKFVALGKQLEDHKPVDGIFTQTIQIPAADGKPAATITVPPTDSLVLLNAKITAAGGIALANLPTRPPIFMVVNPELTAKHEADRTNRIALTAAEEAKLTAKKAADAAEAEKLAELKRRSDPKWISTEIATATAKISAAKDNDDLVAVLCAEAKRLRFPSTAAAATTAVKSSVPPTTWTCGACAKNQPYQHNFCTDCGHPAPPRSQTMSYAAAAGGTVGGSAAAAAPVPVKWICQACTFENDGTGRSAVRCEICAHNNPNAPRMHAANAGRFRVARGGLNNGGGGGQYDIDHVLPAGFANMAHNIVQRMAQLDPNMVGRIGGGGNNGGQYDDADENHNNNNDGNRSGNDDDDDQHAQG
jgi:hypothetical protein